MKGKVAIVTGAASGVGRATVQLLAKRGAKVIATDIREEKLADTVSMSEGEAEAKFLDVSKESNWQSVIDHAVEKYGTLDILINNAATTSFGTIDVAPEDEWHRVFGVNAFGVFLGCQKAMCIMKESGGSIVNVASNSAFIGFKHIPIYTASKGAVVSLSRAIAAQTRLEKLPVRCNTVVPGGTDGDMVREAMQLQAGIDLDSGSPEAEAILANLNPADKVATAIAFLASDEASCINGTELMVDQAESFTYMI